MPSHYYQSGGLLDPTLAQQPRREPGSGLIGPIDRNPVLGFISDRLSDVAGLLSLAGRHPASRGVIGAPRLDVDEAANRFGLDDLSGLQEVSGLLDDMSYGFSPVQGKGMTARLDPRVADLADVTPMGKAATAALMVPRLMRRGANNIDDVDGGLLATMSSPDRSVDNPVNSFDARFDPRAKQKQKLADLEIATEGSPQEGLSLNLSDLEGQPFLTSMSDRTAAGDVLTDINGVPLFKPIPRTGGQGFMFENPGMVWASGQSPTSNIMNVARKVKAETGQDPLFIPWRMAPTASDFQIMQGEVMLGYAASNMSPGVKRTLNARMKKFVPNWKGVDDPESFGQWRQLSTDARKQAMSMLDVQFKDRGGLSIGEARVAISDPAQFNARDAGIQNVGRIFADDELMPSGNVTFPTGVPGEGLGTLNQDVSIFELLPDVVEQRKIPNPQYPRPTDTRSMQMGARSGIITPEILQKLEGKGVNVGAVPLIALIGSATAYGLLDEQQSNET